jgi:hypothetical protein
MDTSKTSCVSDISSPSYVSCLTYYIHLSTGSSVAGITLHTSARLSSSASIETIVRSTTCVDHRSIASSKTKATRNCVGIATRLVQIGQLGCLAQLAQLAHPA